MNSYFDEAFRSLDFLTEEAFNLDDEGMKEMSDFIEDDDTETVNVIDPDAETEDDLQDDYVGKVILNCVVCHSNMFEDKDEIEIDEGDTVANVGKECPFCSSRDGFKICGKVVSYDPFKDDDDEDEAESEEEVEIKDDGDEEEVELKDKEREGDEEVETKEEEKVEESLSHRRMVEKLAKKRMGMRECNKSRKVKEDYDETDADEYDHYEDEDEEDVSPRIHREMNRIQRMHDRNAHDIQVDECNKAGKTDIKEVVENPKPEDIFGSPDVMYAESCEGRRKTDKEKLEEEDGLSGMALAASKPFRDTSVGADILDRAAHPVLESSRRDDIDADADDRKEYAKAKFDKIEDDADSDRDYRLKHPKYKGELPRKHKKFDEDFRRVEIETDDETMEMDTKDDGGVTVTTTPKTEPTEEETAEVETTVDDVEVGGEETGDTIAELSDADKEEIISNSEEEKAEAEEEAPAEESETTEVDAEEIKEESFDYVCGKYLKETYSNVKDFKSTCAREKDGKLVLEGVISFASGAKKNTSFIFEAYRTTKSGRLKFLGENVEITPNKKAFTLTAVAKNKVLVAESLSYRYLQEGKRISGICRVIK